MSIIKKSTSTVMLSLVSLGMFLTTPAQAEVNPFADQTLVHFAAETVSEGKCGEGKCGESAGAAKCGEGKCGESAGASKAAAKCGEGKCGEGKPAK